jgi:5'-deoxynucleotidase YfbR-like HD superfamily hydrolase
MLASRTVQVTRTLCDHPDGRAENDAEHSFMLALIAVPLAEQHYPELDSGLVAKYALVHDLSEAYVGDTPTHDIDAAGLETKAKLEELGRKQLSKEYRGIAPSLVTLHEKYEAQQDKESRFVRMLDKLVTISIQFPNGYTAMKKAYGRKDHERMVKTRIERFMADYPDQKRILALYAELARFMQDGAWPATPLQ